jgi:predicted aspartyl protease
VSGLAPLNLEHTVPLVRVFVDHRGPYVFVIDTGTNFPAIVSPKLAARLALPTAGKKRLTDLRGEQSAALDLVTLDSLAVAGVEFRAVPALVNQIPGAARRYDGILGFALFRDHLLTLDFPRRKLLLDQGELLPGTDPNVVAFGMTAGIPTIALTIGGNQAVAGIDTGATGLIVPERLAQTLSFIESPTIIAQASTQVSQFEVRGGTMRGGIRLSTFNFDRPFIEIAPSLSLVDLGADTFRDFVVTFDQRRQLVQFAATHKTHRLRRLPRQDQLNPPPDVLVQTVMHTETPN